MGDGNVHGHKRVPMLLMGHANGAVKGNLHVYGHNDAPQANILLTVLRKLGVDTPSVGNSTGTFDI
jgi:hypothetical protein